MYLFIYIKVQYCTQRPSVDFCMCKKYTKKINNVNNDNKSKFNST